MIFEAVRLSSSPPLVQWLFDLWNSQTWQLTFLLPRRRARRLLPRRHPIAHCRGDLYLEINHSAAARGHDFNEILSPGWTRTRRPGFNQSSSRKHGENCLWTLNHRKKPSDRVCRHLSSILSVWLQLLLFYLVCTCNVFITERVWHFRCLDPSPWCSSISVCMIMKLKEVTSSTRRTRSQDAEQQTCRINKQSFALHLPAKWIWKYTQGLFYILQTVSRFH